MNPHQQHPTSLLEIFRSFWRNRGLIWQMTKREVIGRYRGSILGLAWSFFNPLLMLTVYTFVFSVVFKARWGMGGEESRADFAVVLFTGMIVHGLFAECVNRVLGLIPSREKDLWVPDLRMCKLFEVLIMSVHEALFLKSKIEDTVERTQAFP